MKCIPPENLDIGLLILRMFIGFRLMYGVIDNILSWEHMLTFSSFLSTNDFLFPTFCAVLSVTIQFFAGLQILIGFKTRIAALLIVLNFSVALVFVHFRSADSVEAMTPALAMFFGSLCLLFTGAGKVAIDK